MDYLSISVPSLAILVSAVLVFIVRTESHTEADDRSLYVYAYMPTHATTIGVSNNY